MAKGQLMDYACTKDGANAARPVPREPDAMAPDVETEIKLATTPAMLLALRGHPMLAGEEQGHSLVATYFDTSDGRLARGFASLRVRSSSSGRREQTLKLAERARSQVQRSEWNVAVMGEVPEPEVFPPRARAAVAALRDGAPLAAYAVVRVERGVRRVGHGASLIEVAFDQGTIAAGGQSLDVCELELELLSGQLADVLALALELPLGPQLRWSIDSKGGRCQQLGFGLAPGATRAAPPLLDRVGTVARGFQAIGWSCLGQLLANAPQVVETGDPEAIHQARVAIRRLRAAFSLFGNSVHDHDSHHLRAGIKSLADAMGPARDLYVLGENLRKHGAGGHLVTHVDSRLAGATDHARAVLGGQACQRTLLELALWLERGKWLEHGAGDKPLPGFAAKVLAKRRHRLKGAHKHLAKMEDEALHQLRIEVKKLRYAVGFFASLFGKAPEAATHEKLLGKLQDVLGDITDLATAGASDLALFGGMDQPSSKPLRATLTKTLAIGGAERHHLIERAAGLLAAQAATARWWNED